MSGKVLSQLIEDIYNDGDHFYNKNNLLITMGKDADELLEIFTTFKEVGYTEGMVLLESYFEEAESRKKK